MRAVQLAQQFADHVFLGVQQLGGQRAHLRLLRARADMRPAQRPALPARERADQHIHLLDGIEHGAADHAQHALRIQRRLAQAVHRHAG